MNLIDIHFEILREAISFCEDEQLRVLAAKSIALLQEHFTEPPKEDKRPPNCRFRLQEEGKAYPKSGCQACGASVMNGLGDECNRI